MTRGEVITNSKRKHRIKEFVDKDHKVMDRFYELATEEENEEIAVQEMLKLIKKDPDFCDPYLSIAELLDNHEEGEKARNLRYEAYTRALGRIVDSKGRYPEIMRWGWLENRHVMNGQEHFWKKEITKIH